MKNLFITLALVLNSLIGWSQTLFVPGAIVASTTGTNVGVGTSEPQVKFEVRGPALRLSDVGIRFLEISQDGGGQPYGRPHTNSYSGARQFKINGWSQELPSGSVQKDIVHFDGYNLLLLKDNGGAIGVGTSQPNASLDLFTNTPTMNSFNSQRWSTSIANYFLTLKTVRSNDGVNYNLIQTINGSEYTSLSFFKGDVGIGTMRPDAKLAVKGTVHAEEVKVDLSVPAPDYVFEKSYNLRPPAEVENYINQNKHLPEIPAAKELEANGINLGEMNMLLLKKVEELTLYTIEQNEKWQATINELTKLRAELETLKGKLN